MARILSALLLSVLCAINGCTSAQVTQTHASQPNAFQAEGKKQEQSQEARSPEERFRKEKPQEERDEEDTVLSAIAAAPEYLVKGLAYPFKKFGIYYERTDLMNRLMDLFYNDERTGGVFPRMAVGGALSSGIGFTAFHQDLFHQKKEVRARYLYATRGNQTADFAYRDPSLFGSKFMLDLDVFWLNFDNGFFFLGGNRAAENGKTKYDLNQLSQNARLSYMVAPNLKASLLGRILFTDAGPSSRTPTTPPTVPGIDTYMQGAAVEPSLTYDSRDNPFRPSTGLYIDTGFTYTNQLNGDQFRYMGYWVDVQRYIPVFRGNRVLVIRAYLSKLDSLDGKSIPFYELNLLDLNNGLRGFDRGRWQDKGALLFNLEWRYPVWKDVEGTIFLDQGQVFGDYKDLQPKLFQYSAGGGFRFVTSRNFAFRVQLAASNDGWLALFRSDLEFVRHRGTVLGGF